MNAIFAHMDSRIKKINFCLASLWIRNHRFINLIKVFVLLSVGYSTGI